LLNRWQAVGMRRSAKRHGAKINRPKTSWGCPDLDQAKMMR
jgi:hypothetical protein